MKTQPELKMNLLSIETDDTFATLLELAANNDIKGFTKLIDHDPSSVDQVGLWYGRQKGSKQMVLEHRTPLMVASMYGSIDVLKLILSFSKPDVNRSTGVDKTTALHCAASGGSLNAIEVIKLLLTEGADPNLIEASGLRPVDMILVSPKFPNMKNALQELLGTNDEDFKTENEFVDMKNKKEYPFDPSLPDIKNSIYSTDEFRIFSFKVRPCSRAYSHDWTECPFVHPGENARRRDPRKFHYSCVPCPDFRKGICKRVDMCEYAHGVFECWLHPAQYRTRLCKDGSGCNRRVCFFAHNQEELRPLYVSKGLIPGSPSSFTPPMSPSANGISNWQQPPNVPSLLIPGNNRQWSLSGMSRISDQSMFSPRNKNSLVFNQFQQEQSMSSPINTNSPKNTTFEAISPMGSGVLKLARENQNQQLRSLSTRGFWSNLSVEPWSVLGSSSGKVDWAVNGDELGKLRRSSSFDNGGRNGGSNGEEPDTSWVQSLVRETPHEMDGFPVEFEQGDGTNGLIGNLITD